jgi:hypothetical protein
MIDIVMCLVAAHVLFDVPIRASLLSVMSASFFNHEPILIALFNVKRRITVCIDK